MLGKYRLRPSFLLEVAFLVGVWLVAWRVFDPPLAVLIFVIFAAYGLVFLYENWLDGLSRRERAEARRSLRNQSEIYHPSGEPRQRLRPPSSVEKPGEAAPATAGHSISERLTAKLHSREIEEKENSAAPATAPPAARSEPVPAAPDSSFEKPGAGIEEKEPRGPEPQPVPLAREELSPPPATENAPASVSEAAGSSRRDPALEERSLAEPEKPHSLMADIAAGPDARKAAGAVGGWNIWQLERLLAAQAKPDPERDYERSMLLVYLREFADSDGQLPPEFDDLVRESFADLARGPAS